MSATIISCKRRLDDKATLSDSPGETVNYLVKVQEEGATPYEVVAALYPLAGGQVAPDSVALPEYSDPHSANTQLTVTSKTAERAEADGRRSLVLWVVAVTYGSASGAGIGGSTGTSRNVVVRVSGQESTVYTMASVVDEDSNEEPAAILNAIGDAYPEPQELTLYDEIITISYEADTLPFENIAKARGRINNGVVTLSLPQGSKTFHRTFAKDTLLLKSWDYEVAVPKSGKQASVWKATVTLLWRSSDWLRRPPQRGYRFRLDDQSLSEKSSTIEYLNEEGKRLNAGDKLVPLDPPVQMNKRADLAGLLNGI